MQAAVLTTVSRMTVSSRLEGMNTPGGADAERTIDKATQTYAIFEDHGLQKLAVPASANMYESGIDVPEHGRQVTSPANTETQTVQTECLVSRYSLIHRCFCAYRASRHLRQTTNHKGAVQSLCGESHREANGLTAGKVGTPLAFENSSVVQEPEKPDHSEAQEGVQVYVDEKVRIKAHIHCTITHLLR